MLMTTKKKKKKICSHYFCLPEIILDSVFKMKNDDNDDDDDDDDDDKDDKYYPHIYLEQCRYEEIKKDKKARRIKKNGIPQ